MTMRSTGVLPARERPRTQLVNEVVAETTYVRVRPGTVSPACSDLTLLIHWVQKLGRVQKRPETQLG